tara:strand:- start:461 stop:709 length:249 start_codon:yes stop_codon:yes gene_type:complete
MVEEEKTVDSSYLAFIPDCDLKGEPLKEIELEILGHKKIIAYLGSSEKQPNIYTKEGNIIGRLVMMPDGTKEIQLSNNFSSL